MKVVAFNGSPRKDGNTYYSLKYVIDELERQGIDVELCHIGDKNIKGCTGCRKCAINKDEKCVIDDGINELIQKMKNADGILLGSPVFFSAIGSTMKVFLDRATFVSSSNGNIFRGKVGAPIVAVRRSGGIPAFNQLNNYLSYSEMIIPTSNYWNVIYGRDPGEVMQDEEGKQILRVLAKNMAWLLKIIEYGKEKIEFPDPEDKIIMNFIR